MDFIMSIAILVLGFVPCVSRILTLSLVPILARWGVTRFSVKDKADRRAMFRLDVVVCLVSCGLYEALRSACLMLSDGGVRLFLDVWFWFFMPLYSFPGKIVMIVIICASEYVFFRRVFDGRYGLGLVLGKLFAVVIACVAGYAVLIGLMWQLPNIIPWNREMTWMMSQIVSFWFVL